MASKDKATTPAPAGGGRPGPRRPPRRGRRLALVAVGAAASLVAVSATVGALIAATTGVAGAHCLGYQPQVDIAPEAGRVISIGHATVVEGDSGTQAAVFPVTLSSSSTQVVSVTYATTDGGSVIVAVGANSDVIATSGDAKAPDDYAVASGTLQFMPGEVTKTITVSVTGDIEDEGDEKFFVILSNPTNANLADHQGRGLILDDDGITISVTDDTVFERDSGTQNATFDVELSDEVDSAVTVAYATADGTATAPGDYTATSGTIEFAPGEDRVTITVPVAGDTDDEGDHHFFVNLSGATNATIADGQGTGTIYDDDDGQDPVARVTAGSNLWGPMSTGGLEARLYPSAVWAGAHMVVWGGATTGHYDEDSFMSDGAAYNPADDTWTCLPAPPIPGRRLHAATWTGTEMIIWGGDRGREGFLADGAAYNPATNQWRPLAPAPLMRRRLPSAIWTGTEMIIWGGLIDHFRPAADGAAYNPLTNSWRLLPAGPLAARYAHAAVWTGTEMILWGGNRGEGPAYGDGAAYDPTTNTWRTLSQAPISGRLTGTGSGAWTGTEVIVWGGYDSSEEDADALADGAAYNPITDTWRPLPPAPLNPGQADGIVWTGTEIVLWTPDTQGVPGGAAYDPLADTWRELAPPPTAEGLAAIPVWTGQQVLMWGAWTAETDGEPLLTTKAMRYVL